MNNLVSKTWNRENRAEKVSNILSTLNRSGKAEIKYFKEKSNILSYYLWRGNPQPVNEDDDWNLVKIIYNGILAFEFIELRVHLFNATPVFGGHFFDEHFTELEIQQIIGSLKDVDIFTYREYLSKKKKFFLLFLIVFYILFALHTLRMGNYGLSIVLLCCVFLAGWLRFLK